MKYRALLGTGGIGVGNFFALDGNDTLGREESRSGRFIDRRDYCKHHIVSHYVQTLLGESIRVIPIGAVGDDERGRGLLAEMEEAGLDLSHVTVEKRSDTLYSFCFVYPDGSGGNLTTHDSACARVSPRHVDRAKNLFRQYGREGIALALPEVGLEARFHLLELGGLHGLFRAGSFTSMEMESVRSAGVLRNLDLLALNLDEASRVVGPGDSAGDTCVRAFSALQEIQPDLMVSVTAGEKGSWTWDGERVSHVPAVRVDPVSTAGAGDAFLAGLLVGLALGLTLAESQQIASLCGSCSVSSPHSIHKGLDWRSLSDFVRDHLDDMGDALGARIRGVLGLDG